MQRPGGLRLDRPDRSAWRAQTGASAVRATTVSNYASVQGVSGKGIGIAVLDSGVA